MSAILVLVDHLKGGVSDISYEALSAARSIAEPLEVPVLAAVLGRDVSAVAAACGAADSVLVVESDSLDVPTIEVTGRILKQLMDAKDATVAMIPATNLAWGLGAKVAALTGLPCVNFCRGLKVEDNAVIATAQLYGGKILADVPIPQNRAVVCIAPGSFPPEGGKSADSARIETIAMDVPSPKVEFDRLIEPETGDIDITKQDVLVSVGRGIQGEENLQAMEELAELLGGAVSGSRPVIDLGWLPRTRQVGKSGMIVKPKLYFALGISGAPEHQEGMSGAQLIIAVNTDPKAPIFDIADYGTTADLFDVVPALMRAAASHKVA